MLSSSKDEWDEYRSRCLESPFLDEVQYRLGVVEEYLYGMMYIMKWHRDAIDVTRQRLISAFLIDEAEERRFLEEDAYLLPYRLCIADAVAMAQKSVTDAEAEGRQWIQQQFHDSFSGLLFNRAEQLGRMRVAWEMLDSFTIKRAQFEDLLPPRQLVPTHPSVLSMSQSGQSDFKQDKAQLLLIAEESRERQELMQQFARFQQDAFMARVLYTKQSMFLATLHLIPSSVGVRETMEYSAQRIQAVFRGYRLRRRYRRVLYYG